MAARVLATGILIRLATDGEVRAAEDGRRALPFRPEPPRVALGADERARRIDLSPELEGALAPLRRR